jgi:5-(aminomethyl)-3-furanmethanol phosphate kinase
MTHPARVLKLGGSLLNWPGLREALRDWRIRFPSQHDLLIVGGGPAADWVREMDLVHQLGDDGSHQLAIQAMQLNSELAMQLWPEAERCDRLQDLGSAPLTILFPWPALRDEEQSHWGEVLPHSWDVTSDSIAAWVARAIGARELVVMKSTSPGGADFVDPYFARAAHDIELVSAVNLRAGDSKPIAFQ